MTEITTNSVEKPDLVTQKPEKLRVGHAKSYQFTLSQQEALRRATLLKHRKVSTQLKLDMVQRQLSELKNNSSTSDRQFYRSQLSELSSELQDLGHTLEKVERSAFYARRRMLRYGVNGNLHMSASHPAIYSSHETLDQSSKNGIKSRLHPLMPSPTMRFKKKHLLGELRAVASLSSLHVKSTPHSSCDDIAAKDSKTWRTPLKFLGHIVDNRICRKIWGSYKRAKSHDNISDEHMTRSTNAIEKACNGLRKKHDEDDDDYSSSSSSSSSDSSDESDDEAKEWDATKTIRKHVWKGPVERRVSNNQKQQIDPAVLAEIDDFEKMAAQYIKLHT